MHSENHRDQQRRYSAEDHTRRNKAAKRLVREGKSGCSGPDATAEPKQRQAKRSYAAYSQEDTQAAMQRCLHSVGTRGDLGGDQEIVQSYPNDVAERENQQNLGQRCDSCK